MQDDPRPRPAATAVLTLVTLVAFAANSLLCRMALGADLIDPVTFTVVRLASGAFLLAPLAQVGRRPRRVAAAGSWLSGLALFVYALAFSLAYVSLSTGMGALLLFASVQMTMIGAGLVAGERPRAMEWLGLVAALGGLVYLVAPGLAAPDPLGTALMVVAGMAWGLYSLRGRAARAPVRSTAGNFARSLPMALAAAALAWRQLDAAGAGLALAAISGAVTSGLGYVLWYRALRGLTATRAAIVQLVVPVLAALGGVVVLSESITMRLALASILILGGVAAAVLAHAPRATAAGAGLR